MKNQIFKKLRSHSGETLAEVLVALLIIALSSMLLLVMINTASSMDIATRNRDKTFYEDLTRAETQPEENAESGTIIITDENDLEQTIDVKVYGGQGLASYEKAESDEE